MPANRAMFLYRQQSEGVVIPAAMLTCKKVADALSTPLTSVYGRVLADRWATMPGSQPVWNKQLSPFTDETGYECAENHLHIDALIRDRALPPYVHLRLGLLLTERLVACLRENVETMPARVVMSFDGQFCVVRFHKLRESQIWLSADLEGYQEGVLFLDT